MRGCGDCTACCTVFSIDALAKPAHTPCAHASGGCAIYAERPHPCRAYRCGWLDAPGTFPDAERPDLTGIIPDTPTPVASVPVVLREVQAGDAASEGAKKMLERLARTRLLLVVRYDGASTLHGPDDLVAAAGYLLHP